MGAKVDRSIESSRGPYVYKICGQVYHRIGSLLPEEGQMPKYAQLYVYDSTDEVKMRIAALPDTSQRRNIDIRLVEQLRDMLDHENWLAKAFRMAKDRFKQDACQHVSLKIVSNRKKDGNKYEQPSCSELAGLIPTGLDHLEKGRDLIVEYKTGKLQRITHTNPSLMALQYPLLFPYGEDGFVTKMQYESVQSSEQINRKIVTMLEYYCYQLHYRCCEADTLFRCGRLFQQYIVDVYACIEEFRLMYIKHNQDNMRSELLSGITDALDRGDLDGGLIGKKIILPSSFTGGPRYMFQNYQDAMALCRHFGMPHMFITFTCNAQWPEILRALLPGQRPEDRPDIVCRVFKMKIDELLHDLTTGSFFGPSVAGMLVCFFTSWLCTLCYFLT
jgi:Helitron helicase-like domain at N-terminus